jgi:hypothetical protein
MNTRRVLSPASVILIAVLLAAGCDTQQVTPVGNVYYKLPLLPIQITYDFINQHLQVSLNGEIQTPIGTFGVSAGAAFVEKRFQGVRTLTVETARNKVVYRLEQNRPYSITLPSDENGNTQVIYSGTDDNLLIRIPNPTNETVAGLKEQLRAEQEARQRAEAQQSATPEPQRREGQPGSSEFAPAPTATPTQALTREQCQQLVAQYDPNKFLYIPPECQDVFQAYLHYLQEQAAEAQRRQQQQEYEEARQRQQEEYEQQRQEAEARRRAEENARRRQQQMQQLGNTINSIIHHRRP